MATNSFQHSTDERCIINERGLEKIMDHLKDISFACMLLLAGCASAKPLSDSLPIQGHFSQDGRTVSRFRVERFLLTQDSSTEYADRSLGYKWGGHAVGAFLWSVNIGVCAYEFKQFLDEIKKQNSILDSTGKQEAFSNNLYKITIPLTIGSEVTSFIQTRLYNRSDYLLHKGALAYNESVLKKASKGSELDLHIEKGKYGEFKQGGLIFYEPVLYSVLREQPASRAYSVWSAVNKEIGIQVGTWGGMYLGLAILSYLQEAMGDTSFVIDKRARDFNLRIGISLTAFSIVNAIISSVTRNRAIAKYNETLPKKSTMQQGTSSEKAGQAPDTAETGITEKRKSTLTDTTSTAR
jgi:hypothetical protein